LDDRRGDDDAREPLGNVCPLMYHSSSNMTSISAREIELPVFKYHPDPVATGAIKSSDAICECCGQARGFVYASQLYCAERVKAVCPWCIADGSAAKKFNGIFCDDLPLVEAGLADEIIDEVSHRTPCFNSWQQQVWLSCCNDACEFHGDVSAAELGTMDIDALTRAFGGKRATASQFEDFKKRYKPGGNPAIYKWVCRHCGNVQHYADFT
jgi:uncharacterized protein